MPANDTPEGDACQVCGEDNPTMLREHQLVPAEYREKVNESRFRVVLCANHKAVFEELYTPRLFHEVAGDARSTTTGMGRLYAEEIDDGKWVEPEQLEHLPMRELQALIRESDEFATLEEILISAYAARYAAEMGDKRDNIKNLKHLIEDVEEGHEEGAPIQKVRLRAHEIPILPGDFNDKIEKLRKKGEVYEPRTDHLRTT